MGNQLCSLLIIDGIFVLCDTVVMVFKDILHSIVGVFKDSYALCSSSDYKKQRWFVLLCSQSLFGSIDLAVSISNLNQNWLAEFSKVLICIAVIVIQ